MPVIKRYPNRKLYDTQAKQYITLDGIAELIRQGMDVQVIDHASGEDLTALTLTQIILEQEKKQNGLLPHSILAGIIRLSGEGLSSLQRSISSSLGFWRQIDDEIKRRVQALVNQGEMNETEGKNLIKKLLNTNLKVSISDKSVKSDELENFLSQHQVPTQQDFQSLLDQLEELS